jgi:hypothetical protein
VVAQAAVVAGAVTAGALKIAWMSDYLGRRIFFNFFLFIYIF